MVLSLEQWSSFGDRKRQEKDALYFLQITRLTVLDIFLSHFFPLSRTTQAITNNDCAAAHVARL